MTKPIVLANMIWVPKKNLSMSAVKNNFTPRFYEERGCSRCEHRSYRFDEEFCAPCPNYKGSVQLYARREVRGVEYIGLPIGFTRGQLTDLAGIKQKAFAVKPLDKRPTPKMRRRIRFTGDLFDYQSPAVNKWLKRLWGMLTAPPRTGKTAMSIHIACKIGLRTLILANQRDLLVQFMQDFDKLTDHQEASERAGRPLVGIVKKDEDFFKYEIALATYQRLARSDERMKSVRNAFGTVIVDEAHRASAEGFGKVLNAMNARYKLGISATPKRKDGRHVIGFALFGPVTASAERESLRPVLKFTDLKIQPPRQYQAWHSGMAWITRDKKRNGAIIQQAVKYIEEGRYVVIPVYQLKHVKALVDGINKAMGKQVAEGFIGKSDRETILKKARSGKRIKCVVGIKSIIQAGINVPLWDCMLCVVPMSNPPNQYQEIKRVCTPLEGKPQPIVHHLMTGWSAERGCLRGSMPVYKQYCDIKDSTKGALSTALASSRPIDPEEAADAQHKPHRIRF